ncbi:MAG: YmdB family metallophosphoesterase [Rickettsiales bacterium]|nr:YmdB family metallophosphoesterase [Rickettsiales bacterium]
MHLMFFGDVVGRDGRDAIVKHVPLLRESLKLDAVIVNGDNAAGGFGITAAICQDFFTAGVDVITGGDHIWDQKDIPGYIAHEKRLLRPHNFPPRTPGSGFVTVTTRSGATLSVLHLLGQVFHREYLDSPFSCAERTLEGFTLTRQAQAIVVDMHAEATSEKNAMGYFLDGRVSAVVGSHTHVPTADARILPAGTAYQTDTGMCGNYNSIIGFSVEGPMQQFLGKMRKSKMQPAEGNVTLRALRIRTDDKTGLATEVEAITLDA